MSQSIDVNENRDVAFALLKRVVSDLAQGDYIPTAASVKTRMLVEEPTFSEKNLGFKRFMDFVGAGARNKYIAVQVDPGGFPRIYPASFETVKVTATIKQPSNVASGDRRLKRGVWRAFVDWEPAEYWRFWDKKQSRAVMSPDLAPTTAPWEVDSIRFVKIEAVGRELQLSWMREYAESQEQPLRAVLVASLAPDAELGAFRKVLDTHALADSWRAALEGQVNRHVEGWARGAGIGAAKLFEAPQRRLRATESDGDSKQQLESTHRASDGALRERIRHVIDRMSNEELRALLIPAHFLGDPREK